MAKKATRATLDDLLKKPARTREVTIRSADDSGAEIEFTVLFRSIGSKAYDALLSEHPPTAAQKKEGSPWNSDTFPPALIAACSSDPKISLEDAKRLFESDEWSGGEVAGLFTAAIKVNSEGLDIPFTAKD